MATLPANAADGDFSVDGWASSYAFLLSPNARPNWQVDGAQDLRGTLSVLPVEINQGRTHARVQVAIVGAGPVRGQALGGPVDRYFLGPHELEHRLKFPVYIIGTPNFKGECSLTIS